MAKDFRNSTAKTLGLRNNNPGNLRPLGRGVKYVGQVGVNKGFIVFSNVGYGIRAMVKNAIVQIRDRGRNTVAKYITAYAPPVENDTAKYIRMASEALGLQPHETIPIDYDTMKKLVRLHLKAEIGAEANNITDDDIDNGFLKLKE